MVEIKKKRTRRSREQWQKELDRRLLARRNQLKKNFGLTLRKYKKILNEQGGTCWICLRSPLDLKLKRNLAVDHCHETGRVRGLLCYSCNRLILPAVRDNPDFARRIADYLERKIDYGIVPGHP